MAKKVKMQRNEVKYKLKTVFLKYLEKFRA